jgi:hypothetical protein
MKISPQPGDKAQSRLGAAWSRTGPVAEEIVLGQGSGLLMAVFCGASIDSLMANDLHSRRLTCRSLR